MPQINLKIEKNLGNNEAAYEVTFLITGDITRVCHEVYKTSFLDGQQLTLENKSENKFILNLKNNGKCKFTFELIRFQDREMQC